MGTNNNSEFHSQVLVVENAPTLRDMFAMSALPALIEKYGKTPLTSVLAYEVADDMLKEREKGGENG